jgi:hypothetical protein
MIPIALSRAGLMLLALAAAPVLAPGRAEAQAQCAGMADVMAGLSQRYGERVLMEAGGGDTDVIITVNPDGTTWTALVIRPDGLACIVASGTSWTAGPAPEPAGETG